MKKFLPFLSLLFCINAHAMKTPIFAAGSPSTSVTNYAGFRTNFFATSDVASRNLAPIGGLIDGLFVVASTAPGGSASYTITLQKNGVPTNVACTITGAATSCSSTNSFSIAAGDKYSIQSVPASSPASSTLRISSIFDSHTKGQAIFVTSDGNSLPSTSTAEFTGVCGKTNWNSTSTRGILMPTNGTVSNFFVEQTVASGIAASGKSRQYFVLKNTVQTPVTCTVSETATTCNDTSNSFTFVAGDILLFEQIPTATPSATNVVLGLAFTPDIDGESIHGNQTVTTFSNSVSQYVYLNDLNYGPSSTELNFTSISPNSNIVAKKLRVSLAVAAGTSKTWLIGFRQNNATSALSCSITGNSTTTCTNSTSNISVSLNDVINFIHSPTLGAPTAGTNTKMSLVLYIDPSETIYNSTFYDSKIY